MVSKTYIAMEKLYVYKMVRLPMILKDLLMISFLKAFDNYILDAS